MRPLEVLCQVNTISLGADIPWAMVDIDARPSASEADWLQRRGRVARSWPPVEGDRSYQTKMMHDLRAALKAKQNPLGVSPCGSGKGHLTKLLAYSAFLKGKSVAVVTVRRFLVFDLSQRFEAMGIPHSIQMAGVKDSGHKTRICSLDTLVARDAVLDCDCIVWDEAHLLLSAARLEVVNRHRHIPKVFFSASPKRGDGLGMGRVADVIVMGPTTNELIDKGFLVPSKVWCPHIPDMTGVQITGEDFNQDQVAAVMAKRGIVGNIVQQWLHKAKGLPTVCHAVNRAHAEDIAAKFRAAGIEALAIDANTPDAQREEAFQRLKLIARPKTQAILLDHAGNTERFGLSSDDRVWTLADAETASAAPRDNALSLRRCEDCFAVFRSYVPACPECGRAHVATGREIKERNEALVEYQRERKAAAIERYQSKMTDEKKQEKLKKLIWECAEKQHKPGSLFIKYKLATAENLPEKWKPTVFVGIATIGKYRTACSQLEEVQDELLDKVFAKEQFNATPLISSAKRLHIETEAYKNKLVKMNLL